MNLFIFVVFANETSIYQKINWVVLKLKPRLLIVKYIWIKIIVLYVHLDSYQLIKNHVLKLIMKISIVFFIIMNHHVNNVMMVFIWMKIIILIIY